MSPWLREGWRRLRPGGPAWVGLGPEGAAWALPPHGTGARQAAAAWGADGREPAQAAPARASPLASTLAAALRGGGVRRVELVAGVGLAVHWVQQAPAGVGGLGELRRVAQARCAHLFGGQPEDWRVAGDWRAGRPFACAGLPEALAAAFEQPLAAAGLAVRWHTTWGLLCARGARHFRADGWSALRTPAGLQLWHCEAGHVRELAHLPAPAGASTADLAAMARQRVELSARRHDQALPAGPPRPLRWIDLCDRAPGPGQGLDPVATGWPEAGWLGEGRDAPSEAQAALALALALEARP